MSVSLNRRKHVLFYQRNWIEQADPGLSRGNVAELPVTTEFELAVANVKKSSFSWNAIWKIMKASVNNLNENTKSHSG